MSVFKIKHPVHDFEAVKYTDCTAQQSQFEEEGQGQGKLYYPTGGKFIWSPLHVMLLLNIQQGYSNTNLKGPQRWLLTTQRSMY